MRRVLSLFAVLLLAGTAGLLAGCDDRQPSPPPAQAGNPTPTGPVYRSGKPNGLEKRPAREILAKALAATRGATSLRITGTYRSGGQTFDLDMRYDATGARGEHRLSEGESLRIVRIQNEVWLRAGERFWRDIVGTRSFRDKYLRFPADDPRYAGVVDLTYPDRLIPKLIAVGPRDPLVKGEIKVVNGVRAVEVVDRASRRGGSIWVALQGPPYVVRVEAGVGSRASGSVDFFDYGAPVKLTAPDPRQVVELTG
ncbi:hypothetical protein C3Y87_14390 [Carbonactinospora thermoautotrophica]|uniref:hypothetical protein n=1 Tax=Carbonactinospora thermoautotrophica TaxID=1469144 RepID=UPI00226E92E3|nr:hypothetical protein [Carbonactinospora thermoautotrophica]MCX9192583.1 hypothetical protein [Carbonactinospora thermoautotrophica]